MLIVDGIHNLKYKDLSVCESENSVPELNQVSVNNPQIIQR